MNVRKLMLMGAALMMAAFCAVLARSMFNGGAATQAAAIAPPQPAGPEVLVATRMLPVGTIVTADAYRYQPWPKDLVQQAYFVRGEGAPPAVTGSVVRFAVTAGQPLTQGALVKPGDRGFLAAALGPGMRAVSIAVTAQAGVAGFVFPGDRVDLIVTSSISGGEGEPLRTSETMVRNLRVLATDQRTDKTTDAEGKTVATAFSNVTLETTPRIAEKIAVAQAFGTLSLSLRSIADDRMELERKIAAGEVTLPEGDNGKAEQALRLRVAAEPTDGDPTVTTGGEVSRFQRSTVPARTQVAAAVTAAPVASAPARRPRPAVEIVRGNSSSETEAN